MKSRFNVLIFILLATCSQLYSQKTFIYSEKDSLSDDNFYDATELASGNFILVEAKVQMQADSSTLSFIVVTKLDAEGKLITKKTLFYGEHLGLVNCIVQMNPNSLFLSGFVIIAGNAQILLINIDSSLNVIRSKIVPIPNYYNFYSIAKADSNNHIVVYGNAAEALNYDIRHPFIYKFSETLDSIGCVVYDIISELDVDLLIKPRNTGYYMFMVVEGYQGDGQIINIDSTFRIIRVDTIPKGVYNNDNSRWISDNEFLLTGFMTWDLPTDYYNIGTLVIDTTYVLLHNNHLGKVDTSEMPSWPKNLDYKYLSDIYIGGLYYYYYWLPLGAVNSWFALNHVDTTLDLSWQKFYGGDKNYGLYGLLATKDSGCLMYGSTYDYENHDYGRNVLAIKVNKEGLLLDENNITQKPMVDAIVYPNPGKDYMIVESGPQIREAVLRMEGIEGNEVISERIESGRMVIDTQVLKPGLYIWEIDFSGKVIETGKWIKE